MNAHADMDAFGITTGPAIKIQTALIPPIRSSNRKKGSYYSLQEMLDFLKEQADFEKYEQSFKTLYKALEVAHGEGFGIPQASKPRFRKDKSTTIVQDLYEASKNIISADAQPGTGATFQTENGVIFARPSLVQFKPSQPNQRISDKEIFDMLTLALADPVMTGPNHRMQIDNVSRKDKLRFQQVAKQMNATLPKEQKITIAKPAWNYMSSFQMLAKGASATTNVISRAAKWGFEKAKPNHDNKHRSNYHSEKFSPIVKTPEEIAQGAAKAHEFGQLLVAEIAQAEMLEKVKNQKEKVAFLDQIQQRTEATSDLNDVKVDVTEGGQDIFKREVQNIGKYPNNDVLFTKGEDGKLSILEVVSDGFVTFKPEAVATAVVEATIEEPAQQVSVDNDAPQAAEEQADPTAFMDEEDYSEALSSIVAENIETDNLVENIEKIITADDITEDNIMGKTLETPARSVYGMRLDDGTPLFVVKEQDNSLKIIGAVFSDEEWEHPTIKAELDSPKLTTSKSFTQDYKNFADKKGREYGHATPIRATQRVADKVAKEFAQKAEGEYAKIIAAAKGVNAESLYGIPATKQERALTKKSLFTQEYKSFTDKPAIEIAVNPDTLKTKMDTATRREIMKDVKATSKTAVEKMRKAEQGATEPKKPTSALFQSAAIPALPHYDAAISHLDKAITLVENRLSPAQRDGFQGITINI